MEEKQTRHILLKDLQVYQLARELSQKAWIIYAKMDWQIKKVIGDQFLTATDSFGANVTEGYYRYHFLDKIKFLYNARGSLAESYQYWLELLKERRIISTEEYEDFRKAAGTASIKLQHFITAIYRTKNQIS